MIQIFVLSGSKTSSWVRSRAQLKVIGLFIGYRTPGITCPQEVAVINVVNGLLGHVSQQEAALRHRNANQSEVTPFSDQFINFREKRTPTLVVPGHHIPRRQDGRQEAFSVKHHLTSVVFKVA